MKNILVIGNQSADSFGYHISETIKSMGINSAEFTFDINTYEYTSQLKFYYNKFIRYGYSQLLLFKMFRSFIINNLINILDNNSYDLIICTHDYLQPDEVAQIKNKYNLKIVLWFPDQISGIGKGYFINAPYDAIFLKEPYLVVKFRRFTSKKVYYLPECFNQLAYDNRPSKYQQSFTDLICFGNFHPWRNLQLECLCNYNFKFYGVNPPHWMIKSAISANFSGFPIFNEDKKALLLNSKIVINNLHFGEIYGVSARVFETAGIGAFQLVDHTDAIGELYNKEEIITYTSQKNLLDKINYFLSDDLARKEISNNAKIRTINCHTYKHRLDVLFHTLEIEYDGYPSKFITNQLNKYA